MVSFDVDGLTLRHDMVVTMTDGTTLKTHTLVRFGWTFVPVDNPPPPPMPSYIATGGTDTYHTVRFWVGGAY